MNDRAAKPVRLAATARAKVGSAIWWNWINSIVLAAFLTLIGMSLAYVIGWAADIYISNDTAPSGKEPGSSLCRTGASPRRSWRPSGALI